MYQTGYSYCVFYFYVGFSPHCHTYNDFMNKERSPKAAVEDHKQRLDMHDKAKVIPQIRENPTQISLNLQGCSKTQLQNKNTPEEQYIKKTAELLPLWLLTSVHDIHVHSGCTHAFVYYTQVIQAQKGCTSHSCVVVETAQSHSDIVLRM